MASQTTRIVTARVPHAVAQWLEQQDESLRELLCRLAGVDDEPRTGRPPSK